MKIVQPFANHPLWEFEDVELPELVFDESLFIKKNPKYNRDPLSNSEVFNERSKIHGVSQYEINNKSLEILRDVVHNIIRTIRDNASEEANEKVIDLYCLNPWDMKDAYPDVITDHAGFYMGEHLDNRNVKCNLFINLENNISSTEFKILENPNPHNYKEYIPSLVEWKSPTQKGAGFFYFNTPELWHTIRVGEPERKIAMLGVTIE